MSSPEWLLVVGIAAFYLQDAALLLHYDEFVVGGSRRRWHASPGGTEWSGRFLWLPNPLAPYVPVFRGTWPSASGNDDVAPGGIDGYLAALRPFRLGTSGLGIVLLLVVPGLLWRYPHPLALLAALAVVYGLVGGMALLLWRRRGPLGLSPRSCAWLAVECLACPPHAINLVRKLTLRHPPDGAAAIVAARVGDAGLDRLARVMARRIASFGSPA